LLSSDIDFGSNKILYSNVYAELADLQAVSAATYHGMFAHVHATGKGYYAHAGAWVELANDSDIPTALTDLSITDGTNGQVLTTDGSGSFSFTTISTDLSSSNIGDLSDVSSSAASSGQVLKWDGSQWAPASDAVGDGSGGITLADLSVTTSAAGSSALSYNDSDVHLNTSTATAGQILSWSGSDYEWVADSVGTGGGISNVVEDTTPQLGGDLDVNGNSIQYTFSVTNNGTSDYTFSDAGNHWFPSSENDPVLYLRRGETYVFDVNASGHPFEIRQSSGGSAYSTGVTNNAAQVGQVEFKVPMSAPSTLYYQCTVHSSMGNTINIV